MAVTIKLLFVGGIKFSQTTKHQKPSVRTSKFRLGLVHDWKIANEREWTPNGVNCCHGPRRKCLHSRKFPVQNIVIIMAELGIKFPGEYTHIHIHLYVVHTEMLMTTKIT